MLTEAPSYTQEPVDVSMEEVAVKRNYGPKKVMGTQRTFAKHFHSLLVRMRARQTKFSQNFFLSFFFWIRPNFDYLNPGKFNNPFSPTQNVDKKEQTTGTFCSMILTLELLKNVLVFLCQKLCWN